MGYVKISDLVINEVFAGALPALSTKEFNKLTNSIQKDGLQVPIIVNYENVIIDGHHRIKAYEELGVETIEAIYKDIELEESAVLYIRDLQQGRRNISSDTLHEYILKRAAQIKEELGERRGPQASVPSGTLSTEADITGKRTSQVIAEKVSEDIGVEVSARKVERALSKDKPKKFKEKETVRVVILFFRTGSSKWEVYRTMFDSKKEASDYVKERLEERLPYYNREYAMAYSDVEFLTKVDQMAWKGWIDD